MYCECLEMCLSEHPSHALYSRGPPPGPPSHYSYRSRPPSEVSTVRTITKTGRKAGVVVETMSAPNPFCPNTKGVCCLLLLLNLGLILVTLGFVIVIQFFEPFFVWSVSCCMLCSVNVCVSARARLCCVGSF